MKKAKQWLAAMLVAGMAAGAAAAEIRLEQAEKAVGNWIARGGASGRLSGGGELSGETLEDSDTGAKMHVVRVPGKGFAVTSSDDGIEPIILFSCGDGDFAAEPGNPLWDLLRWDLAGRRKALDAEESAAHRKDGGASGAGAAARAKWAELLSGRTARGEVSSGFLWKWMDPLLKTRWNQSEGSGGAVYNMFTPVKTEVTTVSVVRASARAPAGWTADALVTNELGHYPVGCVAVAGGQVMKYWKWPESAGAKTVTCQVDGESRKLQFYGSQYADAFGEPQRLGSYKWTDMGVTEPHWILAHSSEYVSRLLSDIGVACGAHYRMSGTGMALATLASELKSTFGYANAVYHTGSLSGEALRQAVVPNLDAGAPVMMGIGGAHAVVADAYGYVPDSSANAGTMFLHVNFGWGGASDSWYTPPEIGKYSPIDELVCNVFPKKTGVALSGRVTGPHGRAVYAMDVSCGGNTARTGSDGRYSFILPPGTYQVSATNAWRSSVTAGPQTVTMSEMTRTANGNRILDFQVANAPTVLPIVRTRPGTSARGTGTTFSEPFELTLSCATEGAEIHYTLDGSEPGGDAPAYEGPIPVQDTVTLRAVAIAPGMERSEMLEETYTFVDPQSRDNFADARPISGACGLSSFDNAGYTEEAGEPVHSDKFHAGGASAWARWTAPHTGDWTFWLEGTNGQSKIDTQLAVYTGEEVGRLTRIASNDDMPVKGGSSRLSFPATEGVEYMIAMDTYKGAPAILKLRWEEGHTDYVHFKVEYGAAATVPQSGRVEVEVESSTNWWVVEWSDSVDVETMGGRDGDLFACSLPANDTGKVRTGEYVTVQAGNSERVTLFFRQHFIDFAVTKDSATERAWRENKRILLLYGADWCPYTGSTLFTSIPAVKALLDAGYVLWYSNADFRKDAREYTTSGVVPQLGIIDPLDLSKAVEWRTGSHGASELQALLESSSWPGLPPVKFELRAITAVSATVATKVPSWGVGASSATVALETAGDAAFAGAVSVRQLGTVTDIWTEQEWTFGPPSATEVAFCRVRVSSGDWSWVSDAVEFVPLAIALDNGTLAFASGEDAAWRGQTAVSHDGADAAVCASTNATGTNHFAESHLKTTIQGPGRLSFWWKGDGAYGWLNMRVDGANVKSVSVTNRMWDEVAWDFPDASEHEVEWVLERYNYASGYYNVTGWVDQVAWTPGNIVTLDRQNGYWYKPAVLAVPGEELPAVGVPEKQGYSFGGYYSGSDGLGTQYYTAEGTGARKWDREEDMTLCAKWIPNTYAVVLDRQAGTGGSANATATYGEKLPPVEPPVREGHDFFGYFDGTDGTGRQYYNAAGRGTRAWTTAGNATLYACWQEKAAVTWEYRIENGKAIVTNATPARGRLEVPATLGGCPVEEIGPVVFYYAANLTGIVMPEGLTGIGNSAFYGCSELVAVALPGSVTNIGYRAFRNCTSLESVALPEGLASIGEDAFFRSGLTGKVILPAGVTSVGVDAFGGCPGLAAIEVAAGNPSYAAVDGVLFDKNMRTLLAVPGGKTGAYAIPAGVAEIGTYAFHSCSGVTAVTIPASVTNIGSGAFASCGGLAELVIPDGVAEIGAYALDGCQALARLEVPGAWWGTDKVKTASPPTSCEVTYRGISPLAVATETLPAGTAGMPYRVSLAATGGVAPYAWSEALAPHAETSAASTYAEAGTAAGWQGDDKCWDLALPFAFPYFGESYTNAKVNSNGALSFGTGSFTDRTYGESTFKASPVVAVLWKDLDTSGGDIHVESGADAVTVRWAGAYYSWSGDGGAVNFAATLYRDGRIVFSYGPGNANGGFIGLSAGDGRTTAVSAKSNSGSMENADDIVFTPPAAALPPGLELTADGLLRGMPTAPGTHAFAVAVTDAKGVTVSKELSLEVEGSGGGAATSGTPVPVPHAWLAGYGLGDGTAEGFESAANAAAANGMPVWACYVAGLSPADPGAKFTARISFADGKPVLDSVSPDLAGGRSYIMVGKKDLMDGEWTDLSGNTAPAADGYRFFGAAVSLPE